MYANHPSCSESPAPRAPRRVILAFLGAIALAAPLLAGADDPGAPDDLYNTWYAVEIGNADSDEMHPKEKNWETYVFADDGTFTLAADSEAMGEMNFEGEWSYDPSASELYLSVPGVVENAAMEIRELTDSRLVLVDRERNVATLYSLTPPTQQSGG